MSSPRREAAHLDAAEQAFEHLAEAGVGRPLVVGAAADELVADGLVVLEVVALAEQARAAASPTRVTCAGVGLLEAGDQLQQRRLAVAVAADDPDAVAGRDAERHALQDGACGVALGDVLEVHEIACRRGHAGHQPTICRMGELDDEQRHLDETGAAYDAAFAALTGRKHRSGDDYANEALEAMRRERIRVYTDASGPLYFGRVDRVEGDTLYVGRHAVWSAENELLSVNWRAPAAEPFYTATEHDPQGLTRRRRLDIEDRTVHGFVDEPLVTAYEDHLTEAIVEDITRQRVGEMRQIISTITPDQYELISREIEGALVIQGGPGTGKTAVGLHRAAWLLYTNPELGRAGVLVVGPNETFIRYIEQVLPALGEGGVEQRPIGSLVTKPHGEIDETRELATLEGQCADRGRAAAAAVGPADLRGRRDSLLAAADGDRERGRAAGARRCRAGAHVLLRGGPDGVPRAARGGDRVAGARSGVDGLGRRTR